MHIIIFILALSLFIPAGHAAETVVLLHGIAKTSNSMKPVQRVLREAGYEVLSITYPSTKKNISGIVEGLHTQPLNEAFWAKADKVHFVTHSMGGLVAQQYLDRYRADMPSEKMGRVVMLAPPNGGSEVADLLHGLKPYQWYYGPAGQDLTTASRRKAQVTPYYDLGIIAGTKEWVYVLSAFVVPGSGDGRVSVEKTKMSGMKDHFIVPATHTFIMDRPDVQRQIVSFLKSGSFTQK